MNKTEAWRESRRCRAPSCTSEDKESWMINRSVPASLLSFFSAGGMWWPASGCQTETRAGSAASPAGHWACATTWCRSGGSFTRRSGPGGPAACTTGASRTTGAHGDVLNHCWWCMSFWGAGWVFISFIQILSFCLCDTASQTYGRTFFLYLYYFLLCRSTLQASNMWPRYVD